MDSSKTCSACRKRYLGTYEEHLQDEFGLGFDSRPVILHRYVRVGDGIFPAECVVAGKVKTDRYVPEVFYEFRLLLDRAYNQAHPAYPADKFFVTRLKKKLKAMQAWYKLVCTDSEAFALSKSMLYSLMPDFNDPLADPKKKNEVLLIWVTQLSELLDLPKFW